MIPFLPLILFLTACHAAGQTDDAVAIHQRPLMINILNSQRIGHNLPPLCQDSLLTSMAQQHANDMAALDYLGTDLPCDPTEIPPQYCASEDRLSRFGAATENIVKVFNNETAEMAMIQLGQLPEQASNLINPDIKYVGVGVAYNNQSNSYYWSQIFSTGNYSRARCTASPRVETINSQNLTHTYEQPRTGLNFTTYPRVGLNNLKCKMVPASLTEMVEANKPGSKRYNSTLHKRKLASFLIMALNDTSSPEENKPVNLTVPVRSLLLDQVQLNSTLQAIRQVVTNDSSLLAGLNGTDPDAYNRLWTRLQEQNITSLKS